MLALPKWKMRVDAWAERVERKRDDLISFMIVLRYVFFCVDLISVEGGYRERLRWGSLSFSLLVRCFFPPFLFCIVFYVRLVESCVPASPRSFLKGAGWWRESITCLAYLVLNETAGRVARGIFLPPESGVPVDHSDSK